MKKVISAFLVLCIISTVLPISIIAETVDALTDTIVVNGVFQEWEYCYNKTDGKLYKQKENERIYLFEDYTVTNVFTVNDTIYVWMYGKDGEYLLADAVKESIIEDDCENDIELFATSNEAEIFNFCINNMGLNVAAASGVLANIKCESSFNPNSKGDYQNGVHTSYGICQWHNSRYTNLKNWCNNNGYDYTTLTGQLNFLKYELKISYSAVWNKLNSVENTAEGAYEAGAYWCARFEVPVGYGYWSNGVLYYGTTSIARGNSAKNTYWPKYADTVVETNTTYNASAALTYAKSHWNDGVGLCAEFVSACLTAGGIDVKILTTGSLKRFLINNGYAIEYVVETQQGKRIKMADHSGKISPGDVIINYCIECDVRPHVALVSGCDSSGYVTYYAHNSAADGTKVWWNGSVGYSKHQNHTFKTSVLHMVGAGNTVLHTHSFQKQIESTHPHYAYNVCSKCSEKVSLGTSLQYNCKDCYPLGNVTLTRSFEKTKGMVTFYRNDVENATDYTLKVYNNSGYTKDYSMANSSMSVSVPASGLYFAMLTAKNTNTGETATASCESFKFVDTYTVSYNANGGKNAPANQTKIQDSDLTLSTEKPSREGYLFKGWAASKNAVEAQYPAGGSYTKNAKITLYAVWEPETYTISFDANGGTGEINSVTIKYGDTIKMPNGVVCEYAYLKGWSTDKNATTPTYLFDRDYTIQSDVTLYAVWGQSTWSGSVSSALKGNGTEEDPYLISSEGDLAYLANKVNGQTAEPEYEYYKLIQNINLNFEEWTPIGIYENSYQYFCGSFDGNGYTISDVYISKIDTPYVGLFGFTKDSEIRNIALTGAMESFELNKQLFVGGIVGRCENSTIKNCNVYKFSISGISTYEYVDTYIGCVVGYAFLGEIYECSVQDSYIGLKSGSYCTGMIAGFSSAELDGCTVLSSSGLFGTTAAVTGYDMGGLCGFLQATAKRCTVNAPYLSNNLETSQQTAIGGLVGWCEGNIEICAVNFTDETKKYTIGGENYYSSILIKGTGLGYAGGLVGYTENTGKVTDCKYNGKSISYTTTSGMATAGGMVGNGVAKKDTKVRVNGGQSLNILDMPTKSGYEAKWYTDLNCTQEYDFSQVVETDTTLYAKWEESDALDVWDGTVKEPSYNAETKTYIVTNGEELAWVAQVTRGKITTGDNQPDNIAFSGYTIEITKDIYLNDISDYDDWETTAPNNTWIAIGASSTYPFSGTINGNNYNIIGAYYNKSTSCGFVNYLSNGTIKNVNLINVYIAGHEETGGVVARSQNGTLLNCSVNGVVSGKDRVGGIAGCSVGGTFSNCYNYAQVSGESDIGGICGYSVNSVISYCGNYGQIWGESYTGGICGCSTAVTDSITASYNEGEITANDTCVGGICGYSLGSISKCYNIGDMSDCENATKVGGIVGSYQGQYITYCYNSGDVYGERLVGGIVGEMNKPSQGGEQYILYAYNRGDYNATEDYSADIVGCWYSNASSMCLSACYGRTKLYNIGSNNYVTLDNCAVVKTTSMKTLTNMPGLLSSKWAVNSSVNGGYPYLIDMEETHKNYIVTAVAEIDKTMIDRSFAKVDGIIYSQSSKNAYSGGVIGRGFANSGNSSGVKNVIIMADKIGSNSSGSSSYARSGYMIGYNMYDAYDFSSSSYYANEMDISAVNSANSVNVAINVDGTERGINTLSPSFYTAKMGLKPYVSLSNLEDDETAVWVLKDGEIPELYYNVLRDITISADIVNGTVIVDREQAVDGEIVTLTVTPDDGYVVNTIYVNGEAIVGNTFPVSGDGEVYVTFNEKIAEYNVKVKANDNATGTVVNVDNSDAMTLFAETDKLIANDGEEVLVNTKANEDYAVDTIYVNGEEVAGNNFIVTSDSVVTMEVVSISTEVEAITNDAEDVSMTTAVVSGSVLTEGDGVTRYIKYWSTDEPTDVYTTEIMVGCGDYRVTIEDLEPGTNYCYQMTEFGQIKYLTTISEEAERMDISDEEYEAIYGPDTISVTGVTLSNSALTLTTGESATLVATIEPLDATNQELNWTSSNTNIAEVVDGVVEAKSTGSTTIIVTTEDGGFSAECVVTVKAVTVSATGVSLDKTSVELSVGGFEQLNATVAPSNATDKSVAWSSTNESVAMVSSTGMVVGVGVGTAVVVAKTTDGNHTAFCVVTVSEPTVEAPADPEITLSGTDPLTVTLAGELTGKVIVALYNDQNTMIEVTAFDAVESKTVNFTSSGSYVKVIWVESLISLTPKCEAKFKSLK